MKEFCFSTVVEIGSKTIHLRLKLNKNLINDFESFLLKLWKKWCKRQLIFLKVEKHN